MLRDDLAKMYDALTYAALPSAILLLLWPNNGNIVSRLVGLFAPTILLLWTLSYVASERKEPRRWQPASQKRKKMVAVIGAGPSGLVTARELTVEGHEVCVFELGAAIGGAFATAYHGARLTSSNFITAFSSMQPPEGAKPTHWTAGEYCEYLKAYVNRNGLESKLRLRTRVDKVERSETSEGKISWTVTWTCLRTNMQHSKAFDSVAVCVGTHRTPAAHPALRKKIERFEGDVIHSSEYKSAEKQLTGKRVLIVGLGESGSDISLQSAKVSKTTCISTRRGPGYVIPRHAFGSVADLDTSRAHHTIHQGRVGWSSTIRNSFHLRAKAFVEDIVARYWIGAKHPKEPDMEEQKLADTINARIGLPWYRRFGTKNMAFCTAVVVYGAEYKPDIEKIEGHTATFVDGTTFECDVVVLCTGYRIAFPFLPREVTSHVDGIRSRLFKHMIAPALPSLAFIGFCRPVRPRSTSPLPLTLCLRVFVVTSCLCVHS